MPSDTPVLMRPKLRDGEAETIGPARSGSQVALDRAPDHYETTMPEKSLGIPAPP